MTTFAVGDDIPEAWTAFPVFCFNLCSGDFSIRLYLRIKIIKAKMAGKIPTKAKMDGKMSTKIKT